MSSTANSMCQRWKIKQVFRRVFSVPIKPLCEWLFICETSDAYVSQARKERKKKMIEVIPL